MLIAWENEALLAVKELGKDKFEIVVPRQSILAEPPVAVDKGGDKHGTRLTAQAYLDHLYSEGQERSPLAITIGPPMRRCGSLRRQLSQISSW